MPDDPARPPGAGDDLEALLAALDDPDPARRLEALEALLPYLASHDVAIRRRVAQALVGLDDDLLHHARLARRVEQAFERESDVTSLIALTVVRARSGHVQPFEALVERLAQARDTAPGDAAGRDVQAGLPRPPLPDAGPTRGEAGGPTRGEAGGPTRGEADGPSTGSGPPKSPDSLGFELSGGEPSAPAATPAAERPGSRARVVNTGFAPQGLPDQVLDRATPLTAGQAYYFWLEVGPPARGSIEATPTDLPDVPLDARLTVTVVGYRDGLVVTPGADVGELRLMRGGTVVAARQPLVEAAPRSRRARRRLFFPVRAPEADGTYRMRCNIYWGHMLLQSRLVSARVMPGPVSSPREGTALTSKLDYTLARRLDPAHLAALGDTQVSLLVNRNDDGTHSLHVLGTDGATLIKRDDLRFDEGELQGLAAQMRAALGMAAWGSDTAWDPAKHTYRYADRRRDARRLTDDLVSLASWGYEAYSAIAGRLAGDDGAAREAFEAATREPGAVLQIAHKASPALVLPAALLYDHPFDVGAAPGAYRLCPAFADALDARRPLAETACFTGACPSHGHDRVVCPGGFWGFRLDLGLPISIEDAPDAPATIDAAGRPRAAVGLATNLQRVAAHRSALDRLAPGAVYAETRDAVFEALGDGPHVVYFYCHGGLLRGLPYLEVGRSERIFPSNLRAKRIRWDAPRPLVFLNGCHTTAVEPLQALSLIRPLVTYSRSAGVIGTEITVFEEMATVFAEALLAAFLGDGSPRVPIGRAVRLARLALLAEGNPLGLAYIPFVHAWLRLVDRAAGSDLPSRAPAGGEIDVVDDKVVVGGTWLPIR